MEIEEINIKVITFYDLNLLMGWMKYGIVSFKYETKKI